VSSKPTILCVDDEQNVLDVLCRMFDRMAIVVTANSGPEALKVLQSRPIDLLITDQKMPEMTGIELVREARREGIAVTTILLTAYTNPNDLIAAINDGQVFRYVTKPWDINDLTMTVRNALSVAALRKEKEKLLGSLHKRIEALNVMYEVSRQSAKDAPSLDAIVDRLLNTVGRVLPHDASAVLIESSDGETAALRIKCTTALAEAALLHVKDSVLSSHRKAAGVPLPEDRVITNVSGVGEVVDGLSTFACAISVPLVSQKETVGTLALFSTRPDSYSTEDGELLDLLVNQTTDAITHVRAAEREARQRIEQMVEAMVDGVILTDAKGGVVVVNGAARGFLGLPPEETRPDFERLSSLLGLSPFDLVRGWEYSGAKTVREELKLGVRDVELVVTPVAGAGRELKGLVLVMRDVSEQKLLTQRKDEFVGIISHELRTPLTSISGALDLVLNRLAGDVTEKQKRFLSMARESTERLNLLVDDLLDLAKFEQGAMRMDFQLMRLDELVRTAVERYGPAFVEKDIDVVIEITATDVKLLADPNRLNQVINNLLTNAVKFTGTGGQVKVTVGRSNEVPGSAVLSVWNSGEPIAEGDLERIFDRFEQARTARTRSVPGTGLGLSICKTIVEGHGGRIWAEPVNEGARFVAVFPEEPPEKVVPVEEGPKPARGSVLIVEDEASFAWLLKAQLLHAGFKAVVATNGEEALAVARKLRPDVITLDHRLPDVEGLKLLEILRHDPETKSARVIVVSGVDVREETMRAGASGFLQKPLSTASFLSSVEAALHERRGGRGRVLVVDDDAQITAICAEVLRNQGFDVDFAGSVAEAKAAIARKRPELLLLDVALPDGDGFSFFEELKADRAPSPLSVIFISARGDTSAKVRALKLGGDDYLTKPFDALELGARVESVLRRRTSETGASPTTQLPGSAAIEREVQRRLAEKVPFAFCYLDLDNLKAFNDFYGYAKADGVVRQTADILREVVSQLGDGSEFVGHVAGDDFVFIVRPDQVDFICRRIIESFDRIIPLYYERDDRERGFIEAEDRYGQRRKFPVMSVSIAAVMSDGTVDHPELARQAAELKKRAKAVTGSVVLRSDQTAP
jgi:DNA-binding response OmpR family regulator/signal transduction histidine kinase